MKHLSRIIGLSLTALLCVGLLGCQSVASAPASVSQSLRQDSPPQVNSNSSASVFAIAPAPTAPALVAISKSEPAVEHSAPAVPAPVLEAEKQSDRKLVASLRNPTPVASPPPAVAASPAHPFNDADLYLHFPPQANPNQPLRVLVVLHGMGGQGAPFSQTLIAEADKNNWLIVAPTLPYRDYMDLTKLTEDDLTLTKMMADTLDGLPKRLNLKLRQRALVYGFSRGGQLAHRFALMYPEHVGSVVTMSAGSYTLPQEIKNTDKGPQRLPFPFGIGDLEKLTGHPLAISNFKRVSFWIGVGDKDNCATDVPRAFDPYIGDNRIERARKFEEALRTQGINVRLVIFPNVGHEITTEMRQGAIQFLRETTEGMSD